MSAAPLQNAGMKDHYTTFAGYNAWANRRLYDAAAALSDAEYRADQGAFFKSMHGTLNHLLATDRIWMKRFTGEGEAPDRLDAILHDRLADLARRARGRGPADRRRGSTASTRPGSRASSVTAASRRRTSSCSP